jgi:hypothetical protein
MRADVRGLSAVVKGLADVESRLPGATKRVLSGIGGEFVRHQTRANMGGRPGLMRRTGSLVRSLTFRTTGSTLKTMQTRVGFSTARAAMIARVHELGTVGKGGSLPDIRPKSKPWLAWPVRDPGRARGGVVGWARAKKVSIPPRLRYFATFYSPRFQNIVRAVVARESRKVVRG